MWTLYRNFSWCYTCAPIFRFYDSDSNVLCILHSLSSACILRQVGTWTRMVEIATNPYGYRVHAGEVLKRYTPDKNQATPARYHISGNNYNLDISHSYCSELRSDIIILALRNESGWKRPARQGRSPFDLAMSLHHQISCRSVCFIESTKPELNQSRQVPLIPRER
jgi:hypothetical protein